MDVECTIVGKFRNNSNVCQRKQFWDIRARDYAAAIEFHDVIMKTDARAPPHTAWTPVSGGGARAISIVS